LFTFQFPVIKRGEGVFAITVPYPGNGQQEYARGFQQLCRIAESGGDRRLDVFEYFARNQKVQWADWRRIKPNVEAGIRIEEGIPISELFGKNRGKRGGISQSQAMSILICREVGKWDAV